ncbi:MAG: TetR/AcrR family transcriptional regulator [Candidatus Krumholzibacteriia bacterium]
MAKPKGYDVDAAIDGAMGVFWRQGYAATSIDDLEKAMGIKRSSLYHAFSDKERLFTQTLRRYNHEVAGDFLGEMERGGGLAAIRRFFERLLEYHLREGDNYGCLMTNSATELAPHDPVVRELVYSHLLRIERSFLRALKVAQAQGEVAADAPVRDIARQLTAINHGLHVIAKLEPSPAFLKGIVRNALGAIPLAR